jgi:hypothetical protein
MIVGATPSTDQTILATASRLYDRQNLRRVYYSAYSPIPHGDERLPPRPPPLVREHRLYQADWLIRFYGYDARELTTSTEPNLDLLIDPKLAWALRHREVFPVDLNRAPKWKLLRVPASGCATSGDPDDPQAPAPPPGRPAQASRLRDKGPPVRGDGRPQPRRPSDRPRRPARPRRPPERQLDLFELAASSRSGEV